MPKGRRVGRRVGRRDTRRVGKERGGRRVARRCGSNDVDHVTVISATWNTSIGATPVGTVRGGTSVSVRTWDAGKVVTRTFYGEKVFTTAAYPTINYAYAGE
ncbi:hypothetical protein LJC05_01860 [Bacteroides sp. OttesenSCG-928-J23]|nr:hypothetical protein [Bacteroides sp. OttesenSCG-928-J23]